MILADNKSFFAIFAYAYFLPTSDINYNAGDLVFEYFNSIKY